MGLLGRISFITVIVAVTSGLSGCASSLIGKRFGSDRISLADANQVTNCKPKGETLVSVLTVIGFINRPTDAVEDNLYQLARNDAVDSGADTLVKGESKEFGKRSFKMYNCRP
ncbi:MAG: DUF4156 domain-containing protein [Gallionella sp.]